VGNGRSEICRAIVTHDDQFAFTTNFADGAVSSVAIATDGSLSLEDAAAGIAVDGMTGLRDEDLSGDGRFLHVIDADGGRIYVWSVSGGASWIRSGHGRACRRPWPGSRPAEAGQRCDWRRSDVHDPGSLERGGGCQGR
jgi:hypothetical protein